jgi:hypothetical protein
MSTFYHLCFVVRDIDAAAREMTQTLGVSWSPVRDGRFADSEYRIERVLDTTQTFQRDADRWRIRNRSTQPIHPKVA